MDKLIHLESAPEGSKNVDYTDVPTKTPNSNGSLWFPTVGIHVDKKHDTDGVGKPKNTDGDTDGARKPETPENTRTVGTSALSVKYLPSGQDGESLVKLRFLKPQTRFMRREGEAYGPFVEGDEVALPELVAGILLRKGIAAEVSK